MKQGSLSRIFNSALIGSEETPTYKCLYTYHSGRLDKAKDSFGRLKFFNDESLSPQESMTYTPEEDIRVVLLPLAGSLNYNQGSKENIIVQSEQIKILELKKGLSYTINNPFEEQWINYLHFGFSSHTDNTTPSHHLHNIEFKQLNELVPFGSPQQLQEQTPGHIGIYQGRHEGVYTLINPENGVFVYVIKGAFEVHGRLLEEREGLSLWNTGQVEFEALSNNAIIMLLEIQLNINSKNHEH